MKTPIDNLLHVATRTANWLERLANAAEDHVKDSRFPSLADACARDSRDYRAACNQLRDAVEKMKETM